MKTSTLPSIRVEAELRRKAERLLAPGQSLSSLLETLVREGVEARLEQKAYLDRALAGAAASDRDHTWRAADAVLAGLGRSLRRAKAGRRAQAR